MLRSLGLPKLACFQPLSHFFKLPSLMEPWWIRDRVVEPDCNTNFRMYHTLSGFMDYICLSSKHWNKVRLKIERRNLLSNNQGPNLFGQVGLGNSLSVWWHLDALKDKVQVAWDQSSAFSSSRLWVWRAWNFKSYFPQFHQKTWFLNDSGETNCSRCRSIVLHSFGKIFPCKTFSRTFLFNCDQLT